MIDGTAPGTAPVIDPVATVVLCADTANVDTVIIGGKIRKRDGKLVGRLGAPPAERSRPPATTCATRSPKKQTRDDGIMNSRHLVRTGGRGLVSPCPRRCAAHTHGLPAVDGGG